MQTKKLLEAPILDALNEFEKRPDQRAALSALNVAHVLAAAFDVANEIRRLAREEDDRREARKESLINYRRFYVGGIGIGVMLGRSRRTPYEWWVFGAANTKPSKKADKYCAEMRIIRAAKEVRCAHIGGLVVVGENQPDKRSGLERRTLDPCPECRDYMRHPCHRHMFSPRTRIATQQPLSQFWKVETLSEMMAAHKERWVSK